MENTLILELFTLFCVGFIGALTPGPDILFTLRNTLNYGAKAGFLGLFGIFLGWITFKPCVFWAYTFTKWSAYTRDFKRNRWNLFVLYCLFAS